jgi:hypothetical protein
MKWNDRVVLPELAIEIELLARLEHAN